MTVPVAPNLGKGRWLVRNIVIFNPANRAIGQHELGEVLRPRGWRIAKITNAFAEALQMIAAGEASFLVIDDTSDHPAVLALRKQLFHVHALLTPTVVLWTPTSNEEKSFIQRHGSIEILNKPFSPLGFLSCFDKVINRYSSAPFSMLRSAYDAILAADMPKAFSLLTNLAKQGPAIPIAASALALFHLSSGRLQQMEKLLLHAQGISSHSVALHAHLIHLYLSLGLPLRALAHVEHLNEQYANPLVVNIDAMQAHLLLNDVRMAIGCCRNLILKGFLAEDARKFLPRLLFSGGFRDEFDAAISYKPAKFMQYDKAWYGLDEETAQQRCKLYEKNLVLHGQRTSATRHGDAKTISSHKKSG